MRKITSGLIIAAFFTLSGFAQGQERQGPRIEVKELRYDAGRVVEGTALSHVFEFRNTGTETLVIERVQPT